MQIVVHLHNGGGLGWEKEHDTDARHAAGEPSDSPLSEGQSLRPHGVGAPVCDLCRTGADSWLPGTRGGGVGSDCSQGQGLLCGDKNGLELDRSAGCTTR